MKKRFDFWLTFAAIIYVSNLLFWMFWFIRQARGNQ